MIHSYSLLIFAGSALAPYYFGYRGSEVARRKGKTITGRVISAKSLDDLVLPRWKSESKFQWQRIQYLESGIHCLESRIQVCIEFSYMGWVGANNLELFQHASHIAPCRPIYFLFHQFQARLRLLGDFHSVNLTNATITQCTKFKHINESFFGRESRETINGDKLLRYCTQIGQLQRTKESTHPPSPPLHSKLGCSLFSTGSSNSGTILYGRDGGGKALEVSKTSETPFWAKCLN